LETKLGKGVDNSGWDFIMGDATIGKMIHSMRIVE
jgi:hypothetical protein